MRRGLSLEFCGIPVTPGAELAGIPAAPGGELAGYPLSPRVESQWVTEWKPR